MGRAAVDRRRFLAASACGLLAAWLARPALAAPAGLRNVGAFNARSLESVLRALELPPATPSSAILIDAPDLAENGANVPLEVTVKLPGVERILVIAERNLFPLLADVSLLPRAQPWVELKAKLAETSHVQVLALAGGKLYSARRAVRVIVGGCLGG